MGRIVQCLTCGEVGEWGRSGRCPTDRKQRQRAKDRTPSRRRQKAKYNREHRQLRAAWEPLVRSGVVTCWRCAGPLDPKAEWHLGHRPGSDSAPEHIGCNLAHSNEGRTR